MKIMETKTKRNFIIWGVVFLVILNISSLGTIWYHRYQFTHNRMQRNSMENSPRKRSQRAQSGNHRGPSILTKDLDLSDKQNQRFDSVWQHYSKFRRGLETKMESNRKEMGLIMLKEEIDTSAVEDLNI